MMSKVKRHDAAGLMALVLGALAACDSPAKPSALAIVASETAITLDQGASRTITISVRRTNLDKPVTLTILGTPDGISASFTPSSVPAGVTSTTLHVAASAGATPGATELTIRATADGVAEQTETISLTVILRPNYVLSVASPSVTVAQGGAGFVDLLVTRGGGFSGNVALTLGGAPSGVSAALDPAIASANAVALRLTATPSATRGTYTLTITGSAAGMTDRHITLALVVIPPPATANLTFEFCPYWMPAWFAYQNEGYAWQRVSPTGSTATIAATEKVGIAWVFQYPSAVELVVVYATRSEFTPVSRPVTCAGGKSLTGSVAALGANQTAVTAMGLAAGETTPPSTTFTLSNVADGPLDLIATRAATTSSDFIPDKFIIRRSLDLATGATIPQLDFSTSEAFPPRATNLTITGAGLGEPLWMKSTLWTGTSTVGLIHESVPDRVTTMYSIPPQQLGAGDLHELIVQGEAPFAFRWYNEYFAAAGPEKVASLGPYVGGPTVTPVTGTPYLRMRGQLAAQSQYGAAVHFIFGQLGGGSRNAHVFVTAAYGGGTPSIWDVVIPDLSETAGFQTSWMPMPDQSPFYQVDAYSTVQLIGRRGLELPLFPPRPQAGDIHRYSIRLGRIPSAAEPNMARLTSAQAKPSAPLLWPFGARTTLPATAQRR